MINDHHQTHDDYQSHHYQVGRFLNARLISLRLRTRLTSRCGGTGRTPASSYQVGGNQTQEMFQHKLKEEKIL